MSKVLMCDSLLLSSFFSSLTVYPRLQNLSPHVVRSFVRSFVLSVVVPRSLFFLFSPCHKHIHTSSFPSSFMICSPGVVSTCAAFDIHGYACSNQADCMLKKGCSSRPSSSSFILSISFALSLSSSLCLFSRHSLYDDTSTFVHWSGFFSSLLHRCCHHCLGWTVDQHQRFPIGEMMLSSLSTVFLWHLFVFRHDVFIVILNSMKSSYL